MKRKLSSLGIPVIVAALAAVSAANAAPGLAEHYLAVQAALAADTLDQVQEHAAAIAQLVTADAGDRDTAGAAARQLAGAEDLEAARAAFGELSGDLIDSGLLADARDLRVAWCPMAKQRWLQAGDRIANPYYGSKMLRCGEFVPQPATKNQ